MKLRNINQPVRFFKHLGKYLKIAPLFLFLGLMIAIKSDLSGGKMVFSTFSGWEKYLIILFIVPVLIFVCAVILHLFTPPILQCEFKDGSYKQRLELDFSDAKKLWEIVKTTENLKIMNAMIKLSLDNNVDSSHILTTLIASIGIFVGGFTLLLGFSLVDGGIFTALAASVGAIVLNLVRVELSSQNLARRTWLVLIEKAQNLTFDEETTILTETQIDILSPKRQITGYLSKFSNFLRLF